MSKSILKLDNLSFSRGETNFQNLSLDFDEGEIICILGNNGAGKSTLLKLITGILEPSNGKILFKNNNINSMSCEERSKHIAYLPQNAIQAEGTSVLRFVALATEIKRFLEGKDLPSKEEEDFFLECLKKFDASHLADRDISSLSGGEWGRVQLSRVWAQKTPLVVLDEPDTGLDIKHVKELSETCTSYAKDSGTIIFCSHDINLSFAISTRIVLIDKGHIVLDASTSEFIESKILEKHFDVDFSWIKDKDSTKYRALPKY